MTLTKAIARAWIDADYKAKLLSDPQKALNDVGVDISAGTTVKVLENTADIAHFVIPIAPDNAGELCMNDLERVAAGSRRYPDKPDNFRSSQPRKRLP